MKRADLPVEAPCEKSWSTMTREGQKRFCDSCKKHVHDLSSMTPAAARATLDAPPAERLCVRYLYDDEGNILFRPSYDLVPPSLLARARRFVTAAGVIVAPLSLTACMGAAEARPVGPPAPMASEMPTVADDAGAPVNENVPVVPAAVDDSKK